MRAPSLRHGPAAAVAPGCLTAGMVHDVAPGAFVHELSAAWTGPDRRREFCTALLKGLTSVSDSAHLLLATERIRAHAASADIACIPAPLAVKEAVAPVGRARLPALFSRTLGPDLSRVLSRRRADPADDELRHWLSVEGADPARLEAPL